MKVAKHSRVEEQLRETLSELNRSQAIAQIGHWKLDLTTNVFTASDEGLRIFGFPPDSRPKFDEVSACIHPDHRVQVSAALKQCLLTREKYSVEIKILRKDNGEVRNILSMGELLCNAIGEPKLLLGTNQDITDRKKIDEALQEALSKAESGDRLKTAFMNNISHEIRTPLNAILGFSELIIQPDQTDEEKKQFFSHIKTSSIRLINTINNYMDISLLVSGNMEVIRKPFGLNTLLHNTFDQFKTLCVGKNLILRLDLPPESDEITCYSDAELLQKAFSHLLDNAIKFTGKGEISFGYTIKAKSFEFFVKDTGSGIGKDSQKRIFDSFVQEETSMTRGYEGNGLGLAIAQGVIRMLGGEIRVESEKGNGAVFLFYILADANTNGIELNPIKEPEITVFDRPVVLIAEDDEPNRFYLERILRSEEIVTYSAENGIEAVELCRAHPEISLVFMDLKMPVMDGFEAIQAIRVFRKDLLIIGITAYASSSDKARAMEAGCVDYLSKPVSRELLLGRLTRYGLMV